MLWGQKNLRPKVLSSGIERSIKDEVPSSYLLRIDSFSELCDVLKKLEVDKYESPEFEAGNYKWKLVLHPGGDLQVNEKDHISLYLEIADIKAIPPGGCVSALFKLSVYDQIRDKYLTIHDGRVRRFHTMKTKHGFHRLLPLSTFKDPTNGYLVGNCCAFGAEVHVFKSTVERQKLSFEKNPAGGTYTWELKNFSKLDKEYYHSPVFTDCRHGWRLILYPKGNGNAEGQHLSLYLGLSDGSDLKGEKIYLEFDLTIKNQVRESNIKRKDFCSWLDGNSREDWGSTNFILLSDILNSSEGFLANDTLIVEARITRCSRIEAFS